VINYRWRIALFVSLVVNLGVVLLAGANYPHEAKVQPQSMKIDFSLDSTRAESQVMEPKSQPLPESVRTQSVSTEPVSANPLATAPGMEVQSTMAVHGMFEAQKAVGSSQEYKDTSSSQIDGQSVSSARPSAGYTPPRLVKRIEPIYPDNARIRGLSGMVRVKAMVTASGTVGECHIIESSGVPDLDQVTLTAIAEWKFAPATDRNTGNAIDAYVTLPVVFRLR